MYKGIPKSQTVVLTYLKDNKPQYIVTVNQTHEQYTLYLINGKNAEKIKTANNPTKFKEVYPNMEGE